MRGVDGWLLKGSHDRKYIEGGGIAARNARWTVRREGFGLISGSEKIEEVDGGGSGGERRRGERKRRGDRRDGRRGEERGWGIQKKESEKTIKERWCGREEVGSGGVVGWQCQAIR